MPTDPQQRRLFQIGGVVAAIVAFVLIVHPFNGAGLTGTWVGSVTMQTQQGKQFPSPRSCWISNKTATI
jgi:hypothetical protein